MGMDFNGFQKIEFSENRLFRGIYLFGYLLTNFEIKIQKDHFHRVNN